jgi:hypothetical protein
VCYVPLTRASRSQLLLRLGHARWCQHASCTASAPLAAGYAGCRDAAACTSAGCNISFTNGRWYEAHEAAQIWGPSSAGYLCDGLNYASAASFAGRPFGSFSYNVPPQQIVQSASTANASSGGAGASGAANGGWSSDPLEARIMGGQPADNEDIGVSALTLEVYGCCMHPSSRPQPVCSDGRVVAPEQCDLGAALVSAPSRDAAEAAQALQVAGGRPLHVLQTSLSAGTDNVSLLVSSEGSKQRPTQCTHSHCVQCTLLIYNGGRDLAPRSRLIISSYIFPTASISLSSQLCSLMALRLLKPPRDRGPLRTNAYMYSV